VDVQRHRTNKDRLQQVNVDQGQPPKEGECFANNDGRQGASIVLFLDFVGEAIFGG
jgi:hypothetical protein